MASRSLSGKTAETIPNERSDKHNGQGTSKHPGLMASSFWSPDYESGIKVIFDKLHQGCAENNELATMVQDRVSIENAYALSLQTFRDNHPPTPRGFDRDEGASMRQAYVSFVDEITAQGAVHAQIASQLDQRVRGPLVMFSQAHLTRVRDAESLVNKKLNAYSQLATTVQKSQAAYYAKCRQRDDLALGAAAGSPEGSGSPTGELDNPRMRAAQSAITSLSSELSRGLTMFKRPPPTQTLESDTPSTTSSSSGSIDLAGVVYTSDSLFKLISSMLADVPLRTHRTAMFVSYTNVTSGSDIVLWLRKRLNYNVSRAEKFGQGLIRLGYLKPVGQLTNKFVGSQDYHYQWLPSAFSPEEPLPTQITSPVSDEPKLELNTPQVDSEEPAVTQSRIDRDISEAEELYKNEVCELDRVRCDLERTIFDMLDYMEHCEEERLHKLKKALHDFATLMSWSKELESISQRLKLFQESVNPAADLRYLVDSYRTSIYQPRVLVYKSFSDNSVCQTFGVDVVSAPFAVPLFIDHFSSLKKGEMKLEYWVSQEPLAQVHQLRNQINTGKSFDASSIFSFFSLHTVVSTLKQLLLELPDSLISFTVYDTIKSIYQDEPSDEQARFEAIAVALVHLPKLALQQLQLLLGYLKEAFADASSDEKSALVRSMATYLFRPRVINQLNMKDQHPSRLISDLMENGETVFAAVHSKIAMKTRQRSLSEAHRRTAVEARNKEIAAQMSAQLASRQSRPRPPSPLRSSVSSQSLLTAGTGLRPLTLSPSRQPAERRLSAGPRKSHHHSNSPSLQLPVSLGASSTEPSDSPAAEYPQQIVIPIPISAQSQVPTSDAPEMTTAETST